jgi:NADH-quinone oxidoreductase subunit K
MLPIGYYFFLSFGLFFIGVTGALLRRNPAIIAMSVALIATAAAINFVTFSRFFGDPAGQNFALILCGVAFAEAIIFTALFAKRSANDSLISVQQSEVEAQTAQAPPQSDVAE